MAATRLIPMHIKKGQSARAALSERLEYAMNPAKTEGGKLISTHGCEQETAVEDFVLAREEYVRTTGREYAGEVIAYQIRQSFLPGEITPEEANRTGLETALRFTKGTQAFVVATHVDRAHIHNHIIFSAVAMDCTRKFRNFWGSSFALQRVSDLVCMERKLSVIVPDPEVLRPPHEFPKREKIRGRIEQDLKKILEKKPLSFEEIMEELRRRGYEIRIGKHVAVKGEGQERFIRLDSLSEGFRERDLREKYGTKEERLPDIWKERKQPAFRLLIDIEKKLKEGKGKGYERFAKNFNAKQVAKALVFIEGSGIRTLEELQEKADAAVIEFNACVEFMKEKQKRMDEIDELKNAIRHYAEFRDVFVKYRDGGYKERFYEEHRRELVLYQEAVDFFKGKGYKVLPKMKDLKAEWGRLLQEKLEAGRGYQEKKERMTELLTAKRNVEMVLGIKEEKEIEPVRWERKKEERRERQ